jgi:hypothetical protein
VDSEKIFLSGVHLKGVLQRDSYYYSDSYDRAMMKVSIRVATGIGGLKVS